MLMLMLMQHLHFHSAGPVPAAASRSARDAANRLTNPRHVVRFSPPLVSRLFSPLLTLRTHAGGFKRFVDGLGQECLPECSFRSRIPRPAGADHPLTPCRIRRWGWHGM
jgi:hypothetical protein